MSGSSLYCKFSQRCVFIVGPLGQARVHIEITGGLVRKNADNAVSQLQMSQKLANTSAVKADDIEYAWNTIMNGIQQYKEMEKQYSEIRKDEAKRIEAANRSYLENLHDGSAI